MVGHEHFLQITAYELLRFGIYDVVKIWRKRLNQLINQLIIKKGYCRIAPATPGLLITHEIEGQDIFGSKNLAGQYKRDWEVYSQVSLWGVTRDFILSDSS